MAGGGDHSHGGDFRTKVWSMSGGPYCRPVHWKRNTAIALAGIVLVCIPVALKSAELEEVIFIGEGVVMVMVSKWRFWKFFYGVVSCGGLWFKGGGVLRKRRSSFVTILINGGVTLVVEDPIFSGLEVAGSLHSLFREAKCGGGGVVFI
ncbi:hypothetical protein MTR67_013876 [Solanum verrucosum]|uniref:Uncharacterized protein n=1 Tax=Solanum verrucosum TaxID=315347 RepID=A0AAF0QC15_SOLVR|nr:hypothetical protein MTR67_013876 [Solanum verrucosum]